MSLSLRRGRVTAVRERHDGLVRLEVDGVPCLAYPRLTGPVAIDDDVVVNTQARELGLGSGGFDVLHVNLTRGLGLSPDSGAHVMKLPYTSLQVAVNHVEEDRELPSAVDGLPVVCCTLHSQVAPVCAALGRRPRIAYVQVSGGALPVSMSDTLRILRKAGLVGATVGVGPCVDGDVACVTIASALAWVAAEEFDVAVCSVGPGIVGTGSELGHGALTLAETANAAIALDGRPVLAPRVSTADARDRHRPVSHHVEGVLRFTLGPLRVAWPAGLEAPTGIDGLTSVDVSGWEDACAGLPLSTMGRGPADDPWFFAAAFAAGRLAGSWLDAG